MRRSIPFGSSFLWTLNNVNNSRVRGRSENREIRSGAARIGLVIAFSPGPTRAGPVEEVVENRLLVGRTVHGRAELIGLSG
jgi:hypothetical protein